MRHIKNAIHMHGILQVLNNVLSSHVVVAGTSFMWLLSWWVDERDHLLVFKYQVLLLFLCPDQCCSYASKGAHVCCWLGRTWRQPHCCQSYCNFWNFDRSNNFMYCNSGMLSLSIGCSQGVHGMPCLMRSPKQRASALPLLLELQMPRKKDHPYAKASKQACTVDWSPDQVLPSSTTHVPQSRRITAPIKEVEELSHVELVDMHVRRL